MGQTRMQVTVFILLLFAATGVVAVHASPTCERFVRNYVTKPVRNRVSKATDLAWAQWRIAHPNWKPNPNAHRPKYVMTREETIDKVAFACEAPTVPRTTDMFFTPADFSPPPVVALPPMQATQIAFPDVTPPEVAEIPPALPAGTPPGIYIPPFIPPVFGGAGLAPPFLTPEPSSFVLVDLGLAAAWLFWLRRYRGVAV